VGGDDDLRAERDQLGQPQYQGQRRRERQRGVRFVEQVEAGPGGPAAEQRQEALPVRELVEARLATDRLQVAVEAVQRLVAQEVGPAVSTRAALDDQVQRPGLTAPRLVAGVDGADLGVEPDRRSQHLQHRRLP
jgi:hypothetical protein